MWYKLSAKKPKARKIESWQLWLWGGALKHTKIFITDFSAKRFSFSTPPYFGNWNFLKTWQIMCRNLSGLSFFRIIECRLGKYMRQKGSFKFTVKNTVFENPSKCRAFSKTRQNWLCFGIFYELLFIQNVNVARKVEWDFFWDFQTPWLCLHSTQPDGFSVLP